jgi:hypothetical protein
LSRGGGVWYRGNVRLAPEGSAAAEDRGVVQAEDAQPPSRGGDQRNAVIISDASAPLLNRWPIPESVLVPDSETGVWITDLVLNLEWRDTP